MENQGFVSIWVGIFEKKEELESYLQSGYDEEDEYKPCLFEIEFGLEENYNENFREAEYIQESTNDPETLFKGCSYDERLVAEFIETYGETLPGMFNAMILLYNLAYNKKLVKVPLPKMVHLGTVRYE